MRKKALLFIVIFLFALANVNSQTADRKWCVGIHLGLNQYGGDLGNGFYHFGQGLYGQAGLSFSGFINRFFDFSVMGNYGNMGYAKDSNDVFHEHMLHANINLRLKFLGDDKYRFQPFAFGGLGFSNFKDINTDVKESNLAKVCGLGFSYRITPVISLQLAENFIFTERDKVDGNMGGKYNDYYLQHSIGVLYHFGKLKDSDGDGIADKDDLCPTIAGLAKFNGCPDTDNDGVPDKDDKCPNTPSAAKVDAKGCPLDTDGDGIADYLDKCPDVKGLAKLDGCPDSDNDGVADKDDKCPNTPAGVTVDAKGCPVDKDGDGVADYLDKCPDVKGLASLDGCPDRDGDGIPDYLDKCPDVKGTVENKGCPEIKQAVKDVFTKALQGIQFETGSSVIRKASYPILDTVVKIMKENPAYLLTINGHTDNVGAADMNLTLSKDRAESVKIYLINKGIETERLSAFGYGDTKPVADNKTIEGRAKNRRVEFIINF